MNFKQWCEVSAKYTLAFVRNQTLNKKPVKNSINKHSCCQVKQSDRLNLMLKVFSVLSDTPTQSLPPLVDSSVNDVLVKSAPFCNQSFFQMVDVTDLATVDSLLQNAPRLRSQLDFTEASKKFLPGNSVIILLAPYPFSL